MFAMDESQKEFESWLGVVSTRFQELIRADPAKFKYSRRGPNFPSSLVTASRDPELYPNELRCRLSTVLNENGESVSNAVLFSNGAQVDPSQIWSGGMMTPVFKLGYYKNGDDFGLTLMVLKAEYVPGERTHVENHVWTVDSSSNTSGSASSSTVKAQTLLTDFKY